MKKLLFLLALGATTPALAQNASMPASSNAPFKWRLNLQPGQKWRTTTNVSTLMTTPMPGASKTGAPLTMKNTIFSHLVIDNKVLSSDAKGARVEMTYRDMRQTSKMLQGNQVVYDSANPPAAFKGMGDFSKNVVGARLTYLLSPSGQISDIQGVEAFLKRFDAAFEKKMAGKPQSAAMRKMLHNAIDSSLSPDTIKVGLGTAYFAMPKTSVKRGQNWRYTSTLPVMGLRLAQNGQSTFVSRSRGIITVAEKIQFKLPGSVGAMGGLSNMSFRGTSTGQVLVDEKTGLTLEHRTTQNLSTKTAISVPNGKNKGTPMTMKFTSQTVSRTQKL